MEVVIMRCYPWFTGFKRGLSFLLFALAVPCFGQYAGTNGIFAEFNTSMGSFTCRLDYALAPRTVANFIGLATGERAWLDTTSGNIKTNPLYSGNFFHRVVPGFVIQAGAPGGDPAGDPGYDFLDEFHPSLRHDSFGVISMANNGPDSNGSQYFVTVGPQPGLNDVHSVFGRLYGGSNVVYAISRVATDASQRPLTNVGISSVAIRRIGAAAQAFNIHTNNLPSVTNLNLKIARAGANVSLSFTNPVNTVTRLFDSTNLATWAVNSLGVEVTASSVGTAVSMANALRGFFRAAQSKYKETLRVPRNIANKTVTLNLAGDNGTIVLSFNNAGGGNYTWSIGPAGPIGFYNWIQDPYRGRLRPVWLENSGSVMELHLDYDTATSGTFKGTDFWDVFYPTPVGAVAVSGTFTSTP